MNRVQRFLMRYIPAPVLGMSVAAAIIVVLFLTVQCARGAEPQFTVTNKTTPTFTVVNRIPAPAKPVVVASGCGCQPGATCGASFCKANGGGGCPQSCPVKAVNPSTAAPVQTYTLPSATYGNCAGGSCPAPQRSGWYPGKFLGR